MKETTKLKLLKPDIGDQYNIANFNTNADIIDSYATSNDLAVEKAKTDAISTASADATDKANTAQDNAINTASQDATNKVNTSNSVRNIKTYTDFSQIGIDVNNPAVTMLDIYKAIPTNSQFCTTIIDAIAFDSIFPSVYGTFIGQKDGNYCGFIYYSGLSRGDIWTAMGTDSAIVSQWFKQATTAYADAKATDAVAQAKTYADVIATNAVVQANAYTDTRFPDYSAGISSDLSNLQPISYTAPEDGYILFEAAGLNYSYAELSVNGLMLARTTSTLHTWGTITTLMIPVKAGNLIIAKSGWNEVNVTTNKLTFFPMR